ncbi:MAG: EbsA family protein [Bacteroidota bacterium]
MTRSFEPDYQIPIAESILWVVVNALTLILVNGLLPTIIACLILNLLGWFLISGGTHYFAIDNSKLIVRNYLRPWMEKQIELDQITSIAVKDAVSIGNILVIESDKAKLGFSTNLSKDDIDELIKFASKK